MSYTKERVYRFCQSTGTPRYSPHFMDFHLLKVDQNYEYPNHKHMNYEVILVTKKHYYCCLNSMELTVPPGQLLVVQPDDIHQDHLKKGHQHYVLHFQLGYDKLPRNRPLNIFQRHIDAFKQILDPKQWDAQEFFIWMERQVELFPWEGSNFTIPFIQDSLMEAFYWQMINLIPLENLSDEFTETTRQSEFQAKLLHLFESQKTMNLTVEQMAEQLYMSKRNLTLLCQKYVFESPAKAFLRYRLENAAGDLRESNLTIQEVSYRYGFANPFHFTRAFKRLYNVSPSDFRSIT